MAGVEVNGRRFYYETIGTGDPLIFISGLGGDHRAFAVPQRYFAKTFLTLAMDNRDSGQSDRASSPYSTADMADDVAGLLMELDLPPAHVVGQSLGGLVAQQLAVRYPSRVRSLVLASTHAGSNAWKRAVVASWVVLKRHADAADFTRATLPWLVAPGFHEHGQAQIQGLIRFAERNPWPQDALAFERQAHAASSHDLRGRLQEIQAPTLVLTGRHDLVNPPEVARELADLIPRAEFRILEGVGHIPHVENVASFRDAVAQFLESLP